MRIALVSHRYAPYCGGVETLVRAVGEYLAGRGCQVDVLTLDPSFRLPVREEIGRVHVRRFREWAPGGVYFVGLSLLSFLAAHGKEYDIVNAHNYHAMPLLWASSVCASRLVACTHYHGRGHTPLANLLHPLYRPLGRWALARARRVVCASRTERALLLTHFGITAGNIEIVPNGIPLAALRSAEPFDLPGTTLLYVGRLERYKRVDQSIAALAHLPKAYRLYVIGRGPEEATLRKQVKQAGLANRVTFLTDVSDQDLFRWYKSAQALVMMSEAESFPMTSLEAMAAGCRVVCGPFPSFVELAESFPRDVLIAQDTTPRGVAQRIVAAVGQEGRVEADLDDYNWDTVAQAMLDIFVSLS